ncbi:MAG TPA: hypothetical protein VHD63_12720, partial [Ktedonobacteraceae bacterium]|nr:hypothetical protein [Ktedonobacteraceae bacterium]
LGAFSVTCLGLDILRTRERSRRRFHKIAGIVPVQEHNGNGNGHGHLPQQDGLSALVEQKQLGGENGHTTQPDLVAVNSGRFAWLGKGWKQLDYWLGLITTLLVITAWLISLVSKPLATAFGGSVALIGMGVAAINYVRGRGRVPVVTTYLKDRLPDALLAVLVANDEGNDSVISAAIDHAHGKPVVFLYLAEPSKRAAPRLFEVVDPYLEDQEAKNTLKQAAIMANEAKLTSRFVYKQQAPETIANIWQKIRPHAMVLSAGRTDQCEQLSPDYIRYELTPQGKIAHVLKSW